VLRRFAAAMKCDLPKCEICELAKAKRRPKRCENKTKNSERDGSLKLNHLSPGTRVSVDHFEYRQRGRTCDSYGKATSQQYKGGYIFVDHGSSYVHVEHQFGFSAVETIGGGNHMRECVLTIEYWCKIILQTAVPSKPKSLLNTLMKLIS
jgi:hypothetical protein